MRVLVILLISLLQYTQLNAQESKCDCRKLVECTQRLTRVADREGQRCHFSCSSMLGKFEKDFEACRNDVRADMTLNFHLIPCKVQALYCSPTNETYSAQANDSSIDEFNPETTQNTGRVEAIRYRACKQRCLKDKAIQLKHGLVPKTCLEDNPGCADDHIDLLLHMKCADPVKTRQRNFGYCKCHRAALGLSTSVCKPLEG